MATVSLSDKLLDKIKLAAQNNHQSIDEYLTTLIDIPLHDHKVASTANSPDEAHALNALRQNEAQFSRLFDTAPIAMLLVNSDGQIGLVNAGIETLFGYQRKELIGQSVETLIPHHLHDIHIQHRQTFFEHPVTRSMGANLDLAGRHKDGTEFPVEIGLSHVETENAMLTLAFITDISARKSAEFQLQQNEIQLRHLIEAAPIAIILVKQNGQIQLVNKSVETLFGYQRDELINQSIEILLPDNLSEIHHKHRNGFFAQPETRSMGAGLELAGSRRDGTEFPVEIGLSYTKTENETFALAFITDITERKRAHQQMLSLQLEQERVKILSAFIQDAAHEFRTPLTVMRTNLFLAEKTDDEIRRHQLLHRIGQKIDAIEVLVANLSIIARLDTQPNYALYQQNPNDLLTAFINQYKSVIENAQLSLITELNEPSGNVLVNAKDFHNALGHILDNAIRFTEPPGKITIQSIYDNGQATFIIEDTGVGISAEVLTHVFEHFYREDNAHSTYGFGLGLPIARKIIELHHGTIDVHSALDSGTRIIITLPIVHDHVAFS